MLLLGTSWARPCDEHFANMLYFFTPLCTSPQCKGSTDEETKINGAVGPKVTQQASGSRMEMLTTHLACDS